MGDLGVLQYARSNALRNGRTDEKIPVYAPSEPLAMAEMIKSVNSATHPIEGPIEMAGARVSFLPVEHTISCYSVKVEYKDKILVYITDTVYFDALADFARGADLLLCGAAICPGSTHTTGLGHMDARQAGSIAKKAKAKEMLLTHLPQDGDFDLMRAEAEESFGKAVYMPNLQGTYIL